MTDHSTTAYQARWRVKQKVADYREPDWRTDPQTATERHAAAVLADSVDEEELGDESTDDD